MAMPLFRRFILVAAAIALALIWVAFNAREKTVTDADGEERVVVAVYADHYDIGGRRFEGPLSGQLDRFADVKHTVSIHLTGDPAVVSARIPELGHLMDKANIKMAWISEPKRP
jgi:hypothetical protein